MASATIIAARDVDPDFVSNVGSGSSRTDFVEQRPRRILGGFGGFLEVESN